MTDKALKPRPAFTIRPGDLKLIHTLAAAGSREGGIARRLGTSPAGWTRLKARDPRVLLAFEKGRDELELELIARVKEPELPTAGSIAEKVAVMKARQWGATVLGNSIFDWNSQAATDASKLTVTINLPAPAASVDDYRARVVAEQVPNAS